MSQGEGGEHIHFYKLLIYNSNFLLRKSNSTQLTFNQNNYDVTVFMEYKANFLKIIIKTTKISKRNVFFRSIKYTGWMLVVVWKKKEEKLQI